MQGSWKGALEILLLKQFIHAVFPSAILKSKYAIVNTTMFFYICPSGDNPPVVIAVLHERMDMLVRLKTRLC